MRVAILHARGGWHTDQLCRALDRRGHTAHTARYEGLLARMGSQASDHLSSDGADLTGCDAVLARIIPSGSLEQLIFRVNALHWLEARGVTVVNSGQAIERTVDKFYTTALLRHHGIPTPATVVCETATDAAAAIRAMGDVVLKPLFGSMGHGVIRLSSVDEAFRALKTVDLSRGVYYVQQVVEHGGRDYRVFVVGGRVVGAIARVAAEGEWRCNISRGAQAIPVEADDRMCALALEATTAVGADYAGVDLLPAPDGSLLVLEVNGIPGWEGLQQATGLDVADAIVAHLEQRVSAS